MSQIQRPAIKQGCETANAATYTYSSQHGGQSVYKPVNVAELQRAEHVIIKVAQEAIFPAELTSLRRLKTYAAETSH